MRQFSIEGIPTAMSRVPLQRLGAIQRRYLDDWPETGRAVALHGEHGTGKSHTVLFALSEMTAQGASRRRSPVILYVRADAPDPVVLYHKLMSRWRKRELALLVLEAFGSYAADEFIESRDTSAGDAEDVPEQLRSNPELVLDAIRASELSRTAIIDRQESDISRIQGHFGHFERALRALFNPKLRSSAHQWLIGEGVSAKELERLGVPENIDDVQQIRIGIHVLAALARRAGRPLTLAIDQVEAFLRTADGMIERANAGLLRSVVEAVVEEKGLLIAAVGEDAWRDMPSDVRQRFGPSAIELPSLSLDEAHDILAAYLSPWPPDAGQPMTFPFLTDGARQLLVESGGNVRRFIQASHAVFNAAAPDRREIDRDQVVRGLAVTGGERTPSEADVRRAVERTLRKSGYDFRAEQTVDGHLIDYAVVQGNRVLLALQISQAVFGHDEAVRAVRQIETIRALRRHQPAIVLVVVGYSSPEVTDKLKQAAGYVIVASSYGFESDLEKVLTDAVKVDDAAPALALDNRLDQLREELHTLVQQRREDERLVSARLERASTERSMADWQEQLRVFRRSWAQERQRIEQDIDHRRSERQLAEVQEVVHLHDEHVERQHSERRSRVLRSGLLLGAAAVAASGLLFLTQRDVELALLVLVVSAVVISVTGASLLLVGGRRPEHPASGRVHTVEDLNRIARQQLGRDLRSEDPYERYAATLTEVGPAISPSSLAAIAQQEPAAIVRRRFVEQLADRGSAGIRAAFDADLDPASLSVAVERAGPMVDWLSLPNRLHILAQLNGDRPADDAWLERLMQAALDAPYAGEAVQRLAQAFVSDDDSLLAHALHEIPERNLRRATAALSPFDDHGLGAYYWLARAELITELYLFFRKAAFFSAGGLERPPASDPATSR